MSKHIHPNDFKKGMLISSSVFNKYGQSLFKSNPELKDLHKDHFKLLEIEKVYIKSDRDCCSGIISTESLQYAKSVLDSHITWDPETELEKDLYETALKHLANSLL